MQNERLMYSKIRSFMYGVGVLARSANNGLSSSARNIGHMRNNRNKELK
jgi:hypothetical protein